MADHHCRDRPGAASSDEADFSRRMDRIMAGLVTPEILLRAMSGATERKKPTFGERRCEVCGGQYVAKSYNSSTCSKECRRAWGREKDRERKANKKLRQG